MSSSPITLTRFFRQLQAGLWLLLFCIFFSTGCDSGVGPEESDPDQGEGEVSAGVRGGWKQVLNTNGSDLIHRPSARRFYFLASAEGGIYTSTDRGDSWAFQEIEVPGVSEARADEIAASQVDGLRLTAVLPFEGKRQAAVSPDGGKSWRVIEGPFSREGVVQDVVPHPENEQVLYVLSEEGGSLLRVYKSSEYGHNWMDGTDGWSSWDVVSEYEGAEGYASALVIDPYAADHFYMGQPYSGHASVRSLDAGHTWQAMGQRSVRHIDPQGRLYAEDEATGHLLRSKDNGFSWQKITPSINGTILKIEDVETHEADPDLLLTSIASEQGGDKAGRLFISVDAGQSWEQVALPEEVSGSRGVELVDVRPLSLLVSSVNGLWKYTDAD